MSKSPESRQNSWGRKLLAGAFAASILFGVPNSEQKPNIYPAPVTQEDMSELQGYLDAFVDLWKKQDPTVDLSKLRLVTVSGDDTFTCRVFSVRESGDGSIYCPEGDGTIVLTAHDIHQLDSVPFGIVSTLRRMFMVGHEGFHAIQHRRGNNFLLSSTVEEELQATCEAGRFMAAKYPDTLTLGAIIGFMADENVFAIGGGTRRHATVEQQAAAFAQGVNTNDCSQFDGDIPAVGKRLY